MLLVIGRRVRMLFDLTCRSTDKIARHLLLDGRRFSFQFLPRSGSRKLRILHSSNIGHLRYRTEVLFLTLLRSAVMKIQRLIPRNRRRKLRRRDSFLILLRYGARLTLRIQDRSLLLVRSRELLQQSEQKRFFLLLFWQLRGTVRSHCYYHLILVFHRLSVISGLILLQTRYRRLRSCLMRRRRLFTFARISFIRVMMRTLNACRHLRGRVIISILLFYLTVDCRRS